MPPRRILFCNYEYPPLGGGGGTCCRYLGQELARRGHQVEVVTAHWGDLETDVREGNFRLRRLKGLRKLPGQSNPIEMMAYVATAVPYLLFRGGPKPDAIVSFHSIPSGLAAFPCSVLWGVPHIALFRGGDVPGWLPGELELYHKLTLWLNRMIVYQSAEALANSDGLRDLAQKSFPKKKVGVLYNGVDLHNFAPPAEGRAARTGPPRLLFAGRITTQKGIDTMLDALGSDRVRALPWRLDIAGDGPQLSEYQAQAARLGIGDRVVFHGWRERDEVKLLYQQADSLVFPSRYEGMPNVVLEALASGLPVIGTRIAGTEQLIEEGSNGFLIEVDDRAALEERLLILIGDSTRRRTMGEAARRFVEQHWSWQARAVELEGFIEGVVRKQTERSSGPDCGKA